jgi:hypothetical protein
MWDHGTYVLQERKSDTLCFVLHGARLHGPYTLLHLRPQGKTWLLFKRQPASSHE